MQSFNKGWIRHDKSGIWFLYILYKSCLKSCRMTKDLGSWEARKYQENFKVG